MKTTIPDDQHRLWNGAGARGWIETQQLLDHVFQPLEELLTAAVSATGASRVLDVGCGTGTTTLAAAGAAGSDGTAMGIDFSAPMIAIARSRAGESSRARFMCADAETYAFDPAGVDLIISRFGVMFFADPVRAFANLRSAAVAGAALRCLAWRGVDDNPFMTTAERAAAPLLPNLPPRRRGAAGQFGLADPQRTELILEASGWSDIDVRGIDVECSFPESALTQYLTSLGPVGHLLQEADNPTRSKIVAAIRPAFDPFVVRGSVRFVAACWDVRARA